MILTVLEKFDEAAFISRRRPSVSVREETILTGNLKMRLWVNGQFLRGSLTAWEGPT